MAQKIQNLRTGGGDTKSRSVFIIILIVLLLAVVIGYISFRKAIQPPAMTATSVAQTPSIASVPGTGTPSREYVKLQQQQNVQLAQQALRKKTAAIPTLTRTTYLGDGTVSLVPASGAAEPAGCSVEELQRARKAGVNAFELRCRGCSAAALKAAGYSAADLRDAGFTAQQLKDAGYTAQQLRDAGFSADNLKNAGYTAQDLRNAGYSAQELQAADFSNPELQAAGFSADQLAAKKADCSVTALQKARAQGVKASALKSCGIDALKAAGYTARELRDAGYTAGQLRSAGFTAQQLKDAGFTPDELRAAGFSADDLMKAGVKPEQLKAAGYTDGDLIRAGLSTADLMKLQCSPSALQAAHARGVTADQLKQCGYDALKAAGYTDTDLGSAGVKAPVVIAAPAGTTAAAPGGTLAAPAETDTMGSSAIAPAPGQRNIQSELAALQAQQAKQLSQQQYQDRINQLRQAMATQAGELFSSWTPLPKQQYVSAPDKKAGATTGAEQAGASATGSAKQGSGSEANVPSDIYKAGTVIFAVLDTGINSDEKSPILATIVSGKLKGSKVIGQFERVSKKVVVTFTKLSVPYMNKSMTINAYAIDPNSARTALATDVDNHYMLRYGTLFASAFAQGLGEAIQSSGTTTSISGFNITQVTPDLNPTEKALSALGKVGQKFGDAMQDFFNTPPTVRVREGSGLGILLMADLTVPQDQ